MRRDEKDFVRREHVVNGHDDEVSWSETVQILECCGCSELSVRKRSWFSEWDQIVEHPITGEPVMERGVQDQTYPPPLFRPLPRWIDKIEDDSVEDVLREGSCPKSVIGVEGLSIQGVPVRGVLRSTLMRHPSGAWLGGRRRCQTCRHWA